MASNFSLDNNYRRDSNNDILLKESYSFVPLIQAVISWRSYENAVVRDLSEAHNVVFTFMEELYMQRLVWKWRRVEEGWKTYGVIRMLFGEILI